MAPAAEMRVPLLPESKPTTRPASRSGAVFNVSTSIIGAGIMSIPATLKVLGVIPAFLLIVVVALLVDVSVEFLMRFTHSGNTTTYAGVMRESFGRVGSLATQICIMITNLGCLIMYLIILGKYPPLLSLILLYCCSYLSSGCWLLGLMCGMRRTLALFQSFR